MRYFSKLYALLFILLIGSTAAQQASKPHIILMNSWIWHLPGGGSNHFLYFHKHAAKGYYNFSTDLISGSGTFLEKEAARLGLSFHPFSWPIKEHDVINMCRKSNDIITFPWWKDIFTIKSAATKIPLKIVLVQQGTVDQDLMNNVQQLRGIQGVVGHNQAITDYFIQANTTFNLGIKKIACIAPCWDEQRIEQCLKSVNPYETRNQFFRRRFGKEVANDRPLLCTIANMEDPVKNQQLLLQAMNILIYQKGKPVYAVFAGEGSLRKKLQEQAHALGIGQYAHFLGPVLDAPMLLHYADMHVLPSYAEGFPVVNIEAGFMGKPVIVAAQTGGAFLVQNNKTGLLFENNNAWDLAQKIEMLIDNPALCEKMGVQASTYIKRNFLNDTLLQQWEEFFAAL